MVNEECESGSCLAAECSRSCTVGAQCEGGACIAGACKKIGASCSDHSLCTVDDKVSVQGCVGRPISCGDPTFCQDIFCAPKLGCAASARNVGLVCEASPLKACAEGGLATGGCKCSVWQANPIGPYDGVIIKDGETRTDPVGEASARAAIGVGPDAVIAGSARAVTGGPTRAWLARINATQQGVWTAALPPAVATETSDAWTAAAATAEHALFAGSSGDAVLVAVAAIASLGQASAPSLAPRPIALTASGAGVPKAIAVDASGSFAIVGAVGGNAFVLRAKLDSKGDFAPPSQNILKSPGGGSGDTAMLAGAATHPSGWLFAGTAVEGGKSKAWFALTEGGFAANLAGETVSLPGFSEAGFAGVVRRDATWLAFGTARTETNKTTGLVALFDADRKAQWVQALAPDGKPFGDPAQFVAALPQAGKQWLLAMQVGPAGTPWAVRTDGNAPLTQAVGSASRLHALAQAGTGLFLVGDQAARAFAQRIGPGGEVSCDPKP